MELRAFVETLQKAGINAATARAQALQRYTDKKAVEATIKEFYRDEADLPAGNTPPADPNSNPPAGNDRSEPPATDGNNIAREIVETCELAGCPERAGNFIRQSQSIEQVRAILVAERTSQNPPMGNAGNMQVTRDERDKSREAIVGGLCLRAGVPREKVKDADSVENAGFRGMHLLDVAKECLEMENPGSTRHMRRIEIAERALGAGTGDFPYILSTSQNKIMQTAYDQAPVTYPIWTNKGNLADFKTHDIDQLSGADAPEEVPEGAPFKRAQFAEKREQTQLKTYGKAYVISRQALVNDDMNAFARKPQSLALACRRFVNAEVYDLLNTNAAMGEDSVALFDSTSHRNDGTAGAISNTTIGEAVKLLRLQYDQKSNKLNLRPKYFICPVTKEQLAEQYLSNSATVVHVKASETDIYRGRYQLVFDAELDDNSTTAYYLAADQNVIDTITVFFLDGNDMPTLREDESVIGSPQGRLYEVYLDFAAKAIDYRGLVRNTGA